MVFPNYSVVNWEENCEFLVHGFQIHGKILVPKNVHWEVTLYLGFTFAFNVHFIWANHTSNELCYSIDIIQINFKRKFGFVHLSRIYRNFFEKILNNKKVMKTYFCL